MHIDINNADPWVRYAISIGIFLVFLGLAFASRFILTRVIGALAKRTKTTLDDRIIQAIQPPVFVALIALGMWLAIIQVPDSSISEHDAITNRVFAIVYISIVAIALARVVNAIAAWYGAEIATRTQTNIDDKVLPIFRKVANFVIYAIAFMVILDRLNINISPFIASLGIGGLAVALALQSTLTNLLAGTYVTADGVIKKGHYIMLENGPEGYVEEISWRSTKLRHWQGNLIVLPNSKLAEAVVTDFEAPDMSMWFTVTCGVSYDSDLEKVERVALEVAKGLVQKLPEGAKDEEPLVRFSEFGDSNINFAVVLKAANRLGQFSMKTELIKALHKRFKEEGLEIQYPARKLYFAGDRLADSVALAQALKEKAHTVPRSMGSELKQTA
jgi:small-conductance mechanosensitive channel